MNTFTNLNTNLSTRIKRGLLIAGAGLLLALPTVGQPVVENEISAETQAEIEFYAGPSSGGGGSNAGTDPTENGSG